MKKPQFAMFYDFHTQAACPDVGRDFNAEEFADTLVDCGIDYIGFPAKCNQGFCYYNTKIGTRHPSMAPDQDLFGELVAACKKRGIGISAYLNCGLSYENALQHPEWCNISPENGGIEHGDTGCIAPNITPYMRIMCFNTGYHDYLLSLFNEILDQYPVDGFLLDSFNGFSCGCPDCIRKMKKDGLDFENEEHLRIFGRQTALNMAKDIAALVKKRNPELLLNFLGIGPLNNSRIGSYLECECIPTNPCWGYDTLPIMSHYLRTIHKGSILNMTGRFYTWGDFGSLRAAPGVEFDLFYGLANGMRPNIGSHLHPRGAVNKNVAARVKEIYSRIRKFDEYFHGEPQTEVGVVFTGNITKNEILSSVSRMLSELKIQFNIIDENSDWSSYRLLILADDVVLEGAFKDRIRQHLEAGGKIVSTGTSGLDKEGKAFAFPEAWGVTYQGPCNFDPAFFQMTDAAALGLPEMPLAVYEKGTAVTAAPGTRVLGKVVSPYYSRHWDGVYSVFYAPPDKMTDSPFITRTAQVCHCSYPLFTAYNTLASPDLRKVLALMIEDFLPRPMLRTDASLPSFARAFLTRDNKRTMLHLLNYVPELRGSTLIVEEETCARDIRLKIRRDQQAPRRIFRASDGKELKFTMEDGYAALTLDFLSGYECIVME